MLYLKVIMKSNQDHLVNDSIVSKRFLIIKNKLLVIHFTY